MVAEFEKKKKPLVDQMNEQINKFTTKQSTIDQLEPVIMELGDSFNDTLHELWKSLMTIEMQLYEQCEVSSSKNSNTNGNNRPATCLCRSLGT